MRQELQIVQAYAESLGHPLTPPALDGLDRYLGELLRWGSRMNLIGSTDPTAIATDHFCDALAALFGASVPLGSRVVDVGSGAGLPGIPIAIARPDLEVTLVESRRKRVAFLEHARDLIPSSYGVIWARAEVLGRDVGHHARYDVAFERAVAPIAASVALVLPLVRKGGIGVFMKGPNAGKQAPAASDAIAASGGDVENLRSYTLPGYAPKQRTLVIVRRTSSPTVP